MNPETIIKTISDLYLDAMRIGLEDARKKIKNDSDDLESSVENSVWMAYCEGIETAIEIVERVTRKTYLGLAKERVKTEGMRSLKDGIELEGADMNSAYPKVVNRCSS